MLKFSLRLSGTPSRPGSSRNANWTIPRRQRICFIYFSCAQRGHIHILHDFPWDCGWPAVWPAPGASKDAVCRGTVTLMAHSLGRGGVGVATHCSDRGHWILWQESRRFCLRLPGGCSRWEIIFFSVTTKQGCFLVATSQLPLAPRVPKSAKGMRFVNLRSTLNTHEEGTVKGIRDKIMADDIRGRDESTINYT